MRTKVAARIANLTNMQRLINICRINFTDVLKWPDSEVKDFIRNHYQVPGLEFLTPFDLMKLKKSLEGIVNLLMTEKMLS